MSARPGDRWRDGGSVLDVGVGGGASLGLAPKVATITGVDASQGMLELFQLSARDAGVATRAVLGSWPDIADAVGAVVADLGLAVEREDMSLPARSANVSAEMVAFLRRRLHVGTDRDPDIEARLKALPPPHPHTVVALWWPGAA